MKHNKQCTHPFFNDWELPATDWDLSPIDWELSPIDWELSPIDWELCLPEIDLNTWSI